MKIKEINQLYKRVKEILSKNINDFTNNEKNLLNKAKSLNMPPMNSLFKKDYDRRMVHSGFGAPSCYCHIAPPCHCCIEYTNKNFEILNQKKNTR